MEDRISKHLSVVWKVEIMKRTINRSLQKPKLILSADWHLRDDIPQCRRRDEYLAAQERKLKFIHDLCKENEATLLIAGDVFDSWKPSPWLISLALRYIPEGTVVVPGQHDLPAHNLQELGKTGLQTLAEAGRVYVLSGGFRHVLERSSTVLGSVYGYAYGEQAENAPKETKYPQNGLKILMWHRLACWKSPSWPGAKMDKAGAILGEFDSYDLILTGDNHLQFHVRTTTGEHLVNPGSLMRMTSDQAEFEPAVFGWSEDGAITRILLPIEKGVVKITKSNAKEKESRDERMEAYIKRAGQQFEDRLSFDKNLERHFKTNKERPGVEKITWKAVDG
jgi:DNA repair exonuclease SbcCD nuclease subunit